MPPPPVRIKSTQSGNKGRSSMVDITLVQPAGWFRSKYAVFAFIAVMAVYVLYHNERFLIEPANPVWRHYESIGWWLLTHGIAGACALILAPIQFSDRMRARFTGLHRATGRVYILAAF